MATANDDFTLSGVQAKSNGARQPSSTFVFQPKGPERLKLRAEKLERYTDAVMDGRHPRSFPHQALVWNADQCAEERLLRINANGNLRQALIDEGTAVTDEAWRKRDITRTVLKRAASWDHARQSVLNAVKAVSVVKYLEHRESDGLTDEDLNERRKAVLNVRLFGTKSEEHLAKLKERKEALSSNALDRHFRMTDFNAIPGVPYPTLCPCCNQFFIVGRVVGAELFYGCMVALEAPDGNWLSIDRKSGKLTSLPRNQGAGQYVFKLVDLSNPRAAGPIHYGDDCWVQALEPFLPPFTAA